MKCAECMWGVWDYAGVHCVECMADLDEKCPTDADFEHARENDYLAYYGCAERTSEDEKIKLLDIL